MFVYVLIITSHHRYCRTDAEQRHSFAPIAEENNNSNQGENPGTGTGGGTGDGTGGTNNNNNNNSSSSGTTMKDYWGSFGSFGIGVGKWTQD